jgi:ubiquinone/menaquinone biosynthesis C-methylase UbiE
MSLDTLRDVFRWDPDRVRARFSGWFYTYHADLYVHGVPFDVYVEKARTILGELDGARRILDLGSGFGVCSVLLRLLGSAEIVGLDCHAQKVRDAGLLAAVAGAEDVRFLRGDATALPFRPDSFDAAIALASLSHIREPALALDAAARVLRPGGRLYVFEDNNSSHPGYAARMARVWDGAETGRYDDQVPPEKQRAESYIAMRRELIRRRFPDVGADTLDLLAKETRGLYGRHIIEAVERFGATGRIDNPRRHLVCHPESGEFEEYPLSPSLVKKLLRDAGFEPRLRSPLSGPFRGRFRWAKRAAAGILRLCPGLLPWTSPTFAVAAVKR